jgi:hypothetical protein
MALLAGGILLGYRVLRVLGEADWDGVLAATCLDV